MKKVGIITYHASHNYGSALQAFALQKVIEGLNYNCEIINFRTERQKDGYGNPIYPKNFTIRTIIKWLITLPYLIALLTKYHLFEKFINKTLNTTFEFNEFNKEVKNNLNKYDYFISGSDQVWNVDTFDFDLAYVLYFTNSPNKVAYASSCGRCIVINDLKLKNDFKNCLDKYQSIAVREEETALFVEAITGIKPQTVLDPTMLIEPPIWANLVKENAIPINIEADYLLFYTFRYDEEEFMKVNYMAHQLGLKIVIPLFFDRRQLCKEYINYFATGPWEFLSLVMQAKLVISQSFHACVFAIIFQKPFFAFNALEDSRISHLIHTFHLENRSIDTLNYIEKTKDAYNISFKDTKEILERERMRSYDYLQISLNK